MKKNLRKYEDHELVKMMQGSKAESDAAFTEIYDRYASGVFAYVLKILGSKDQADDIFQETFIQFYNKVRADHKNMSVRGFLITIARNLCLNFKRDKKNNVQIEDMEFLFKTYQGYEEQEMLELVRMAIDLLEDKYKEPLVLRVYNGLSYEDIAEICNLTTVNARTMVFRAKQQIKVILKPYLKDVYKENENKK